MQVSTKRWRKRCSLYEKICNRKTCNPIGKLINYDSRGLNQESKESKKKIACIILNLHYDNMK